MPKLSLKIIVISLFMSPFNIQAGWCMEEAKDTLESAARKAGRISQNMERHTFEKEEMAVMRMGGGRGRRGGKGASVEWKCKNCKQLESNCYGFGGGKSQVIVAKAKELQQLLADMEGGN